MNTDFHKELLHITEEIYRLLEESDYELLLRRLAERRAIFQQYMESIDPNHQEIVGWIERIRESEEKCKTLAEERLSHVRKELHAYNMKRRLEKAYR